jgi:hypothetical protein
VGYSIALVTHITPFLPLLTPDPIDPPIHLLIQKYPSTSDSTNQSIDLLLLGPLDLFLGGYHADPWRALTAQRPL